MYDARVTLFRIVNHNTRYYTLHLCKTLFGEYMLIKINGSMKNTRPTRVIKEHYKSATEAMDAYKKKLQEKYKKGYSLELKREVN
ncbi:WGR domain-containing protein (plasmid) [Sulfurimonas aquatica]|uniref:WGR domain-containing protein n=1 Tax=Sulfurimonas aquatica TaxID=2672570 RepID=A0A975B2Q5_9BACT|nr:WGR domain-containing protein [Sulfurimonas aquatica]QSZ43151.1 WGR domain-containing protein [Sulfurimonas aquatica]